MRAPYERYVPTRKLGCGKFSDVYEAVDVLRREADDEVDDEEERRRSGRGRGGRVDGGARESSSSSSRRIPRLLRRRRRRRRRRDGDDNGTTTAKTSTGDAGVANGETIAWAMMTGGDAREIGGEMMTGDGDGSGSGSGGGNYGSSGGDCAEYDDEIGGGKTTSSRSDDGGDGGPRECDDKREDGEFPKDPRYSPSSSSLVVLKCLKPISERKIRRELLVLAHCTRQRLPNLARLIGVVLPDSMDEGYNEVGDNNNNDEADDGNDYASMGAMNDRNELSLLGQKAAAIAVLDRRKRRGRPDAQTSSSSTRSATIQGRSVYRHHRVDGDDQVNGNEHDRLRHHLGTRERLLQQRWQARQLPALVLEHAGPESQWLCHGGFRHRRHQQRRDGDAPPASGRASDGGNNEDRIDGGRKNNDGDREGDGYLSEREVKYYLCHLLIALDALHAAGIMHRDVKPRNTLINRPPSRDGGGDRDRRSSRTRDDEGGDGARSPRPPPLMLVDLGLADFYHPGRAYNVRVASRHYKSPELLIGYEEYDYSVDMWAFGCILAGLLFRKEPFFHGKDNDDQLGQIVSVLGIRDFLRYYRRLGRLRSSRRPDGDGVNGSAMRLSYKAQAAIGKYCSWAPHSVSSSSSSSSMSSSEEEEAPSSSIANGDTGNRKPWLSFLSPKCPVPSPQGLDLLDKLLVYDHEMRWTAREALGHEFFDDVRHQVLGEVQQRMEWENRWRS